MIKIEADLPQLTYRQREVLTALAGRLSNNEVAQFLCIAVATTNVDVETLRQLLTRSESSIIQLVGGSMLLDPT